MAIAPLKLHHWYSKLLTLHVAVFWLESAFFISLCLGLTTSLLHWLHLHTSPWLLFHLPFLLLSVEIHRRRHWRLNKLWARMGMNHPACDKRIPIAEHLIANPHDGESSLNKLASDQIYSMVEPCTYPFTKQLLHWGWPQGLALVLSLSPLVLPLWDQIRPIPPTITLNVIPPQHLRLPNHTIKITRIPMRIPSGSLVQIETDFKKSDQMSLQDNQGRICLPRHTASGNTRWDLRLLEASHLSLRLGSDQHPLQFEMIADQAPSIDWIGKIHSSTSWSAIPVRYAAADDAGLAEVLSVINGREIEYAGSPENKSFYTYAWEFDPLEHINLNGGNVELQVAAYDNDRIHGPKRSISSPLIWVYAGVEAQTRKALEALDKVEDQLKNDRLQRSQGLPVSKDLNPSRDLNQKIMANPVLPEEMTSISKQLQYERMKLQQSPTENTPKNADAMLDRHELYADYMRQSLERTLQTTLAAKMLKQLHETLTQMEEGQSPATEDMEKMYQSLKDLMKGSKFPQPIQDQLLKMMEQAQMANMIGNTQESKSMLSELQQALTQAFNTPRPVDSALQQKYRELLADLDGLIQKQNELQRDTMTQWIDPLARLPRADLARELQSMYKELATDKDLVYYQRLAMQLQQISTLGAEEKQRLMNELQTPQARRGNQLLSVGLAWIKAGSALMQPAPAEQTSQQAKTIIDNISPQSLNADSPLMDRHRLVQMRLQKAAPNPEIKAQLIAGQSQVAKDGQTFKDEFIQLIFPLLGNPELRADAETASILAVEASRLLKSNVTHVAQSHMMNAYARWLHLRNLLNQMQQQASGSMSGQDKLSIGENGEMQMKQGEEQPERQGQDGKNTSVKIAMPEDFEKPENIEKRLKSELESIKNQELLEPFRHYMIRLLQ